MIGQVLVALAVLLLLHSAYSTYEHLSILKALGKPDTQIPTSIIAEALLSFLTFIPGITLSTGPLEDVTWRGEMKRRAEEDVDSKMAFLPYGPAVGKPLKTS